MNSDRRMSHSSLTRSFSGGARFFERGFEFLLARLNSCNTGTHARTHARKKISKHSERKRTPESQKHQAKTFLRSCTVEDNPLNPTVVRSSPNTLTTVQNFNAMKLFMPMSAALALALQAPFVVEAKPGTKAFSIVTPGQSPCHATPWVGSQSDPTAVFFSTIEPANTVYRINGTTGEVKWNVSMGTDRHGVRSSPIEADGLLHIGTDFGEFVALDTETGETVWSYHRPNITCFDVQFPPTHFRPCEVYSSALLTNGIRFQGSEDNHTRAFNASTGELLWTQNATGNVDSTAIQGALGTQTIWIGADGGFLYNLDVKTGENVLPPIAHPGKMESIPTANADRSVIFTMYV